MNLLIDEKTTEYSYNFRDNQLTFMPYLFTNLFDKAAEDATTEKEIIKCMTVN